MLAFSPVHSSERILEHITKAPPVNIALALGIALHHAEKAKMGTQWPALASIILCTCRISIQEAANDSITSIIGTQGA